MSKYTLEASQLARNLTQQFRKELDPNQGNGIRWNSGKAPPNVK